MCQDATTGGAISEDDLKRLVELFVQFEGAVDPLSEAARESEFQFNSCWKKYFCRRLSRNSRVSPIPNSGVTPGTIAGCEFRKKGRHIHVRRLFLN